MSDWKTLEEKSFYSASARERAHGVVDEGTFTELAGPADRMSSPPSARTRRGGGMG